MSSSLSPEAREAARKNAEAAPLPSPERLARIRLILWGAPAQPDREARDVEEAA